MPNKNYINGRRHEYAVRDHWKQHGYTALRSAGSHSPYDVVALKPYNHVAEPYINKYTRRGVEYTEYVTPVIGYAIQCKRRKLK